jgi:F0F1-type ATP synthase membrane subunit b/b'
MSKKWYNYFVSVDETGQPQAPTEPGRSAAQTVADIAATLSPAPTPVAQPSPGASFEEIYTAAEIHPPQHGYTIYKIADMLQSEHIRNLPAEVKRSSILLALDAAGVKLQDIIEDAVRRDRALDTFERVQQKAVEDLEKRKTEENTQIQAELDRVVSEHRARMQANSDAVAKEKDRFFGWRLQKQQEEQKIADTVSHFVTENPITRGQPAASSAPEKGPTK